MGSLQAMRSVAGSEFARLDDNSAQTRNQAQEKQGLQKPVAEAREHLAVILIDAAHAAKTALHDAASFSSRRAGGCRRRGELPRKFRWIILMRRLGDGLLLLNRATYTGKNSVRMRAN